MDELADSIFKFVLVMLSVWGAYKAGEFDGYWKCQEKCSESFDCPLKFKKGDKDA